MLSTYLAIVLAPLLGAIIAGFFGKMLGNRWTHRLIILLVGISAVLSIRVFWGFAMGDSVPENITVYRWAEVIGLQMEIGFLVDQLTAVMMMVVTFVSLMVHVYTIGYMKDDPGYTRFFSYISLFTFAMLMLVMANNFLQLFFGWEAVGLVSYLLIGFWYKKPTAIHANMKAFIVNRVGDFGFLLGIGAVLFYFSSLDYASVFNQVPEFAAGNPTVNILGDQQWSVMTVIGICLFIGAMGKSAQVPLHVWLPDSMEGPTPISALIHAATMVTAGVFLVARMSPIFEFSATALGFVTVIGAITALFMGLLGIVQNDIKRVVAYSTLSQLGYMVVALGVSAYGAAIFHLFTHAFFKALLFLAAGSVIIAMHHEQDIRKMGNLRKYLPITYATSLIGTLALVGTPFFSGFYSKDSIISAVQVSDGIGSDFAYWCVLLGVFVTALYSFRLLFLVFHTNERFDDETRAHLHEPGRVVWVPLVLLAIPSLAVGWWLTEPMMFGDYFGDAIKVLPQNDVLAKVATIYDGVVGFALHGFITPVFGLLVLGAATAWLFCIYKPDWSDVLVKRFKWFHQLLSKKYYFDELYQTMFAKGSVSLGSRFWQWGDRTVIDGMLVNGSARTIGRIAGVMRKLQTGYLYQYAFGMIAGLVVFLGWLFFS